MKGSVIGRAALSLLAVVVCVQFSAAQTQPAGRDDGEVIRVNAELVQTDVTVVDKRGRFVEDLKPEQFELKVGGRAFLNNNSFNEAFRQAVDETSNYYLIAWRPDADTQRASDSRIDVSVKGRPDLRVQLRRRYFGAPASSGAKEKPRKQSAAKDKSPTATPSSASTPAATASTSVSSSESTTSSPLSATPSSSSQPSVESPEKALRAALASLYPLRGLPLALSVGYMDAPGKGTVLAASMQLDSEALDFGESEGADSSPDSSEDSSADSSDVARVDVWGVAIDDRGSFASFEQRLGLRRDALARAGLRFAQWGQQLQLPPGLYQVRVAARDRRTGRVGSATQQANFILE